MTEYRTREERLAAEFEAIAAELRAGEATLYGYRIEHRPSRTTERGAVDRPAGWFAFEYESPR